MTSGPASREKDRTRTLCSGRPTGQRVRLSVYDLMTGTFATSRTFYYRQTLDADALQESLVRTLADHPLLTGRLRRDADGGLSVLCDDAGAVFRVSRSDRAMPDYGPELSAKKDLRHYLHSVNAFRVVDHDTPLLTVKVTQMRGGGSVLGVSINHSIVDGGGFVDFLLRWSRIHRGLEPGAPAPHDRTPLEEMAAGTRAAAEDPQYTLVSGRRKFGFLWRVNAGARRVPTLTTRFSSEEVLALRETAAAGLAGEGIEVSSGDALTAQVWRVLAALRDRPPQSTERLGLVVGLRGALKEQYPEGFWGNAVSNITATLPTRVLREEPAERAVAAVREALNRVTPERIREESAYLEAQRRAGRVRRVLSRMSLDSFEDTVGMNNVSRLPVYQVEFGSGRPFWFEYPSIPIPWNVLVTPTPRDDYSRDVHLSLPLAAAEALRTPEWHKRLHALAPSH
ncbi:acyltransferase [Streptomyces physcomitrii]|uniref:acyltransferase n=1 Tax=Streptomyces physcomitrii TaxID=2724184 RepID=UPI00342B89C5